MPNLLRRYYTFCRGRHSEINYFLLTVKDAEIQKDVKQTMAVYSNQIAEVMTVYFAILSIVYFFKEEN